MRTKELKPTCKPSRQIHFFIILVGLSTSIFPIAYLSFNELHLPAWSIDFSNSSSAIPQQRTNRLQSKIHSNGIVNNSSNNVYYNHTTTTTTTTAQLALGVDGPNITKAHSHDVVVIVLSARSHFDRRQTIRETWGKGHDNIYFVVGTACSIPPQERSDKLKCQHRRRPWVFSTTSNMSLPTKSTTSSKAFEIELQREHKQLIQENKIYQDIIVSPKPESYLSLPNKLKYGYDFVIQNLPQVQWILKADDDFYVNVEPLAGFLQTLNSSIPTVVGKILWWGDPVHRVGKNAEHDYKKSRYPSFAIGSFGHFVSRPVAEYVAKHKDTLFEYQGEDTSLGIWLDESPLTILWAKAGEYSRSQQLSWEMQLKQGKITFTYIEMPVRLSRDGNCTDKNLYVIGHDIRPNKMRHCFRKRRGEDNSSAWKVLDPFRLF